MIIRNIIFALLLLASTARAADIVLTWDNPTTYIDGSPLTDLAGIKLHWSNHPGAFDNHTDVGLTNVARIAKYQPGLTYWIAVTAYNSEGTESDFSETLKFPNTGPATTARRMRIRVRIAP